MQTTDWTTRPTDFAGILEDFKRRFNDNPRARKLVTGWDRFVLLDAVNTGRKYALVVCNSDLAEVRKVDAYDENAADLVHLQADESVLMDVFSGRYNPATAVVDGAMAVFSKDRDKVKLEALAMIIWRIG